MNHLLVGILASLTLFMLGCDGTGTNPHFIADIDDGMPFGEVTDADVEHLWKFATDHTTDLKAEIEKAYQKDAHALGAVFRFALKFSELDADARTYGQIIWSMYLNLGESWGVGRLTAVLSNQDPEVQQRIRDFIYFPIVHLPKTMKKREEEEKSVRNRYPELFPATYEFGHDNPLMRKPLSPD